MDPERTHLDLRVVDWVQTISVQGSIDPTGHSLRARCSVMDDLRFARNAESIAHIPIEVGLSQGPLTVGNGRPLEAGVGIFNYIRPEGGLRVNFVRAHRDAAFASEPDPMSPMGPCCSLAHSRARQVSGSSKVLVCSVRGPTLALLAPLQMATAVGVENPTDAAVQESP